MSDGHFKFMVHVGVWDGFAVGDYLIFPEIDEFPVYVWTVYDLLEIFEYYILF